MTMMLKMHHAREVLLPGTVLPGHGLCIACFVLPYDWLKEIQASQIIFRSLPEWFN